MVAACLSAIVFAPIAALTETRAILIGVSDYDDASGIADLQGPTNDVRLLTTILRQRGVEDITLLVDGVEDAMRPTRDAIVESLSAAAARANAGDLIYLHMSGHGTRQRDQSGDETDGLDEVFLPADVLPAERGTRVIKNALIDDEIGAMIDAFRAKGADVWFVLDSCHSGSGVRAGETSVRTRFVDPRSLGVDPTVASRGNDATNFLPSDGDDLPGGLLAFYAARSDELAREIDFSGDGTGWYGLFSAKLAARLERADGISYRQLFQAVLSDLADAKVPASARLQTPSWDGTFIDAPVFGGSASTVQRQYQVRYDEVSAGSIHGIIPGAVFSLYADATDKVEQFIGLAQVTDVGALRAYIAPVDETCRADANALCARTGALPDGARFARLVASPVDFKIRFSPVLDRLTGAPTASSTPAQDAFYAVLEQSAERWITDAKNHDILVTREEDGLRFSRAPGESGVVWPGSAETLLPILTRIDQAERLAAALDAIKVAPALFSREAPLAIKVELAASALDQLIEPGSTLDQRTVLRECAAILNSRRHNPFVPLAETDGALKQCDQVALSAQGMFPGSYDVNRIHIDAQFCIWSDYELIEGFAASRKLGEDLVLCSDCPNGPSAGAERLYVITTETQANAEAFRLDGIVENCAGATRSAAGNAAFDYLAGIAATGVTRGAMSGLGVANIWIERYRWRVLPRREAFARAGRVAPDRR